MPKPHKCPVCNGTGCQEYFTWEEGHTGKLSGYVIKKTTCYLCKGNGIIWEFDYDHIPNNFISDRFTISPMHGTCFPDSD